MLSKLTVAQTGVPTVTRGQQLVGVATVLLLFAAILFIWYRTRFVGLTPENEGHKDTLWSQLYYQDAATLRLPGGTDARAYASELRGLVDDQERSDTREATVGGALKDIHASAARTYGPALEALPTTALRSLQLAALVVILGAPAVSTAAIIEFLQSDTQRPGGMDVVAAIVDATVTVSTIGLEILTAFPYTGTLFALGLTVVMVVGEWLFVRWWLTVALLVTGAASIIMFDHYRTRSADANLYSDRRNLGLVVAKRAFAVWFVGVSPTVVLGALGEPTYGAILGVMFAFFAGAYYILMGVLSVVFGVLDIARVTIGRESVPEALTDHPALERTDYDVDVAADEVADRLDASSPAWRGPSADLALAGSLFVRRLLLGAWVLVAPLPVIYFASGVSSGAYADVGRAVVAAAPEIQLLVAACVLAPVLVLAYLGRDSLDDLALGVREAWSRRRVRLVAFRRGVPIVAVVIATATAYSFTQSIWLAVIIGIGVGLVARVVYEALMAAKYRVSMFADLEPVDKTVLIEAYALEDGNGVTRYLGVLNGDVRVLADSREEFVNAICDVHPRVSRGEDVATVDTWRAEFALRYGIVDAEETEAKLTEKVRKRALGELRDDKWAWMDDLEDLTADYPADKLESWVAWGKRHGVLTTREDTTGGTIVFLKRDPWRRS